MIRFTSIFALLLTGCPDETVVITPVPDAGIQLIDGAYELHVIDVTSIECDGVRGRDLIGQTAYARLSTVGTNAAFNFEGIEMAGSHTAGWLSVDGSMSVDGDVSCFETQDVPSDDEDAEDSNESRGGGSKGGGSTGCAEQEESERATYNVALDAQVHSTRSAIGDLSIDMDGCAFSVVVSIAWGRESESPQVQAEGGGETREAEEVVEVPCDDDQTDCG